MTTRPTDRPDRAPPLAPDAQPALPEVAVSLAQAIDSVSDGFALWGPDDRLVLCNDSYRAILGKAAPFIVPGVTFEEMLNFVVAAGNIPSALGREEEWIRERMRAHRAHESLEYPTQDRWVLIREHPLPDGHVILTFTDVTALRERAERSRQTQRMEAMGQLTGGVAHDFNNLLTVILGNLQLAEQQVPAGSALHEMITAALDAARHGADLNERLLAFARRQVLTPRATDVNRLVESMSTLIRHTMHNSAEIHVHLSSDLWPTFVDPVQLEAAILNLAVNARDAMPEEGGRLTIETHNVVVGRVRDDLGSKDDGGDFVALTVADNGAGIPRDVIPHIFDPFFTTKPRGGGSGLGLSMVFGFVTQSGGRVHVDSKPGGGTSVRLLLPRGATEPVETPKAATTGTTFAPAEGTVLVTEDDARVRRLTMKLLSSWGYAVLGAASAAEALAELEQSGPVDLLLTDILLEGDMDGFGLARAVLERSPGTRILYMSGFVGNDAALQRRRATDRAAFIDKPFDFDDLRSAVRDALKDSDPDEC